jgi:acyl-coenzyme A synthetase/AMP-(fatty) acid ligase
VVVAGEHPGTIQIAELGGASVPAPAVRQSRESALITHSSGTTGTPKLVLHAADGLAATAAAQMRMARWLGVRGPVAACVSAYHARVVTGLMVLLGMGLPLASISDPDPERAREILLQVKPEMLEAHPNILILWERLAADPAEPLGSVRLFNSTFDAVHPRTIRKLLAGSRRRMPLYLQGLAQTEVGMVTLHPQTRNLRWHGGRCVGWPWPGFNRVRIAGPDGRPVRAGQPGRIQVRSRGRCLTFVGQEEEASARERDGWWDMGDRGLKSLWGCIHMLDRAEESIDGMTSSLAVEDALLERLPELTEVIVIKVEDGPAIPVYATADGKPLGAGELARVAAGLPILGEPVHLAWDQFPRTGTWKVRRKELRRRLQAVPA